MGAALAKLADRDLGEGPEQEGYDRARVQPLADDFDHFVRRSFGAVRASAAADPIASRVFLERLNGIRSEEHTSELQSLMRISYAVFCLKKKTKTSAK